MKLAILACCVILVLYHHVGYPVLLRLVAGRKDRRDKSPLPRANASPLPAMPSVGLLIPAHNEERVIRSKIINCAELDYSPYKLAIVVALDGCKDNTGRVLRNALAELHGLDVRTVITEDNIGKVGVLNRFIPEIEADLVALSDASALLNPDAVRKAAAHFADPGVGVVCGTYVMPDDASPGERAYWRYQAKIKCLEGAVAAPMGAHGAFYVFRRTLWQSLEPDTINDDFVLPMRIVAAGWKAVYDVEVVARELEATNDRQDFRRRVRIGAGNLQQAIRLLSLANPKRLSLAFVFVSGKGLRAVVPFILLAGFAASLSLACSGGLVWRALLGTEVAVISLSLIRAIMPGRLPQAFDSLGYVVQGYIASGLGALLLLSGYGRAAWHVSKQGRGSGSSPIGKPIGK